MNLKRFLLVGLITFLLVSMAIGTTVKDLVWQYGIEAGTSISVLDSSLVANGNIFFVDSGATNASDAADGEHGNTWDRPFASIDYAIGRCTANNGDIILVSPGHSETKAASGALITADIAGVTILGVGQGANRPNLLLSHASAKIDITADNVTFKNFVINTTGADSVDTPLTISGLMCTVKDVVFLLADSGAQADEGISVGTADGDANGLTIEDCMFIAPVAGAVSAIEINKDMENVVIRSCNIYGNFSSAGIDIPIGGNTSKSILIDRCRVTNLNSGNHAIQINGTSCTGVISNCTLEADAENTIVDAGGINVVASTSLVITGTAEGGTFPTGMTLVDLLGDYTGPDSGAAADDNIKAHLDIINAAVALVPQSGGTTSWNATALAAIEGEATDAIEADSLDKLVQAADGTTPATRPASVANNSILAGLLSWNTTANAVADYNNMTMSLPAVANLLETSFGGSGRLFFVDSGGGGADAAGSGDSWASPYLTIDYASSKCTANNGDIILVAAGHAETLGVTPISLAEAGVTIIGLGTEADRPTINFNHANSSIDITAANIVIENFIFIPTIDNVLIGIEISATGDGCVIRNCEFQDGGVSEFNQIIVPAGCDDTLIEGCYLNSATSGCTNGIGQGTSACDNLRIVNTRVYGDFSSAAITGGLVNTACLIKNCEVTNLSSGQHAIEFTAATTGEIVNCQLAGNTYGSILDPGSMRVHDCTQSLGIDRAAIDIPLKAGQTYSMSVAADEVTQDLFSVSGPILIKSFNGIVNVLIGANVTTLKVHLDVDAGATYDHDFSTAVAIETDVAGTMYVFSAANPGVLTPLTPAACGSNLLMGSGWFCQAGMVEQTASADPGGAIGDHITWYMTFTPLVDNVVVIAQ